MAIFTITAIDSFEAVRDIAPRSISAEAVATVRDLDEREEIEPWIQGILFDTNRTPHGPSEVVDVLTHKLVVRGQEGLAAFLLKGRSFPTVRPSHVAHQIFRFEQVAGLNFAIFAASGDVLDGVKTQLVTTVRHIGCDYCILDAHDLARLFIAYGFICPRDGLRISGGRCSCGYTPLNQTSNLLQQEALRELTATHSLQQRTGVIIMPTGSGKTRVAAQDVKRSGARLCIYLAHSHEILESAETEFLREFTHNEVRRFEAPAAPADFRAVNLITIQSLARNLEQFRGLSVDYMIIDEFHHAAAGSYRRAIEALHPTFLLGLTATPFRGDRRDVLALCEHNVVVDYDLRQGIEFGVLCPYHYFGCFDNVDYTSIRHNGQRYDVHDLEKALIIPERDAGIIAKWIEKALRKPTLAFCCSHRHAERAAESFRSHGISAETYLSSTDHAVRKLLRQRLRSGLLNVLCVVDVLNEGVDLPFIECLLFLRPTESKRVFFQQLGRGLRRCVGKSHCTVIDFIGNFKNAYQTVENLGLEPVEYEEIATRPPNRYSAKDILNLPVGCTVEFDDRVVDVFGHQSLNPAFATRHNIGRILIHQYRKLERRLGRPPTGREINRSCLLGTSYYDLVFGSWSQFLLTINS